MISEPSNEQELLSERDLPELKAFEREHRVADEKALKPVPDIVLKKRQDEVFDGLRVEALKDRTARLYNVMFLGRYVLFGCIFVGLQHLQKSQVWIVFLF